MNFQQGWLMQLEPILVHGLATNNFTKTHYDLNMEGSTTLLLEYFVVHCHSYIKMKISPKLSKLFLKIGIHLLFHKIGCP